jgi:CheY-like chemotaxis protein
MVSKKVLIVEDEADERVLLGEILEKLLGLEFSVATDGTQALARARSGVYDLIVLDLNLPNMRGWDLVEAFRQMEAYRSVPIIAVTGFDRAGIRQRTLDAWMLGVTFI